MEMDYEYFDFLELPEAQTRQYVDASASWRALEAAKASMTEEIDVIRRAANSSAGTDPHPLRVSEFEDDFWAVQVPSVQALLGGGRYSQVVVSTNGAMATMHAPLPASLVRIKTSLSQRHDRDPLKRRKDQLHAKAVEQLPTDHGLDHVVRSKGGL